MRTTTSQNVQRFQGGLVFKAHRLCVSLNSRLESNKEEEEQGCQGAWKSKRGFSPDFERDRERHNRLRALRATRPHTVGYIGGCDQEQGGIECPAHRSRGRNLQGNLAYKKPPPPGPYRRPMPRVLGGSWGGGRFLMGEVPLYETSMVTFYDPAPCGGSRVLLRSGFVSHTTRC